ncbi:hypothetical protein A2U01_0116359, partial [Trifolium medium]|nr:hypothetical protein [Trifolium medium]
MRRADRGVERKPLLEKRRRRMRQ